MNLVPNELAPKSTRRPWLTLLAIVFCAEGIFIALFVSPVSHGIDFYHLNFVPQAVRSGSNIYYPGEHQSIVRHIDESVRTEKSQRLHLCVEINRRLYESGFCPTATPFLYALHSLTLVGPFDFRYWIFHIAATIAGFVGLYLTARASGLDRSMSWFVCGLIQSFCWGIFLDAQLANVSRFQLLGLGIALSCGVTRRPWGLVGTGLALAIGTVYKPTIIAAIPLLCTVLIVDRRWRDLSKSCVGLLAGLIFAGIFPLLLFPSLDCWWEWRHFAGDELSALAESFPGNYSLVAALAANGKDWMDLLPWSIAAMLVACFCLTAQGSIPSGSHTQWQDRRLCLAIALGPLWMNLASPLTWVQYSALVMPVAIVLLGFAIQANRGRNRWVMAITCATIFAGGFVQRFFRIDSHQLDCGLFWVGWIGLLVLAIGLIACSGPSSAAPSFRKQRLLNFSWRTAFWRPRRSIGSG